MTTPALSPSICSICGRPFPSYHGSRVCLSCRTEAAEPAHDKHRGEQRGGKATRRPQNARGEAKRADVGKRRTRGPNVKNRGVLELLFRVEGGEIVLEDALVGGRCQDEHAMAILAYLRGYDPAIPCRIQAHPRRV